jgi:hypothetical protein
MTSPLTLILRGRKLLSRRRALQVMLFGDDRMTSLGSGA